MRLSAWTDGGGGVPSGSEAYIGVIVKDEAGKELWSHGASVGPATHNIAEYRAVLAAIRYAVDHGATHLHIRTDSSLIVNQIIGKSRVTKPHLAALLEQVRSAIEPLEDFRIEWVPRKENREADKLASPASRSARLRRRASLISSTENRLADAANAQISASRRPQQRSSVNHMTTTHTTTEQESLDPAAQALLVLARALDRLRAVERELQALNRAIEDAAEFLYGETVDRSVPSPDASSRISSSE